MERGERRGVQCVSAAGEFVIPSSPKNDRSLLFSFFHSSTTVTPFRARFGQDVMDSLLFFGYCLVKKKNPFTPSWFFIFLFTRTIEGIMWKSTVAIFKYVTGEGIPPGFFSITSEEWWKITKSTSAKPYFVQFHRTSSTSWSLTIFYWWIFAGRHHNS